MIFIGVYYSYILEMVWFIIEHLFGYFNLLSNNHYQLHKYDGLSKRYKHLIFPRAQYKNSENSFATRSVFLVSNFSNKYSLHIAG